MSGQERLPKWARRRVADEARATAASVVAADGPDPDVCANPDCDHQRAFHFTEQGGVCFGPDCNCTEFEAPGAAAEALVASDAQPCSFDYDSLPRRDRAWARGKGRPLYLDIEEANRLDAARDAL